MAGRSNLDVWENDDSITAVIGEKNSKMLAMIYEFADVPTEQEVKLPNGLWKLRLNSAAQKWRGPGSSVPPEVSAQNSSKFKLQLAAQSFLVIKTAA